LSFDLIQEGISSFEDIAIFQDYHGLPEFRYAMAKFMGQVRGNRVTFDPNRIVMGDGATEASEILVFCLADPGDAFLVPSPSYPALQPDFDFGFGHFLQLIPVPCSSANDFQLEREALEEAYKKVQQANIKVKGLILANPSNPLGTLMSKDALTTLVSFINEKNIHLVCDEIYSATIFCPPEFVSILEVIQDPNVVCNKDLIHILYSLSNDMGLLGFRVGIVYSYNDAVMACGRKMSSFGLVSSQTQHLLALMLSDEEFIPRGEREKACQRHMLFTKGLEEVGISCLRSNAGLFVWMDLRRLLSEPKLEGEMKLRRIIINDVKLNVSPGSSFLCCEPGWFRVCFANMDDHTMKVVLLRIRSFVSGKKERLVKSEIPVIKDNKRPQKSLCLSFAACRLDGSVIMSPRIMSLHSPLPYSPMV
ncbi:LOW QUALITY PROTEIN: Aminotransferase, class I/classII, partial [Dillenia turbinata]